MFYVIFIFCNRAQTLAKVGNQISTCSFFSPKPRRAVFAHIAIQQTRISYIFNVHLKKKWSGKSTLVYIDHGR